MAQTKAEIAAAKKAALAKLKLTDAQIIAQMKIQTPWIYQTYLSPEFTPAMKKTLIGWAKDSAAGFPPTLETQQAQTYNWPMTQLWSANQSSKFTLSFTAPGEYKQQLANAQSSVLDIIAKEGIKVNQETIDKAVNQVFLQGIPSSDPRIANILNGSYHYDPADYTVYNRDGVPGSFEMPTGGTVSKTISDFKIIAANYGIPLPKDPIQMDSFVKNAIGPNGSEQAFTDWAKASAKILYPFMSASIDAGATVKGWLQPIATNIANVLDITPDSIDWSQPKWSSLIAKPVAQKGEHGGFTYTPQSINDMLTTVKTDPQYGYDKTMTAKNSAYDLAANIKAAFGRGVG